MHKSRTFSASAFGKTDRSPDLEFYREPRFVTHIDDDAVAAVTSVYAEVLPHGGTVLDLMSSWVSHLPANAEYSSVVGHGMNARELEAYRGIREHDAFLGRLIRPVPSRCCWPGRRSVSRFTPWIGKSTFAPKPTLPRAA